MLAPSDPYFMERVHDSTLGKLVFTNGYYDIREKRFIKGHEGVESMVCVPHTFPEKDEDMMAEVTRRILIPAQPDDGQRTLMLQTMSRAAFGHIEDKRLSVHEGAERNNGKGTLQDITRAALGSSYVGAIGSANFIKGSGRKAEDPDKGRMWMFAGQHARFVFSNEMEGDHIHGETIKAWASGGDPMRARKLFRMPIDFKLQAYLIFNVNDFPPVSPPNAVDGIMAFRFDVKFETQAQLDQHRKEGEDMSLYGLADPHVKDFARSRAAGAAFLHILIDHYVDKAPEITPEMRSRQLAYAAKTEEEVIAALIELTQNPKDYVSNSDLNTAIGRDQASGITVNRIGNYVRRRYSKMVWQVRGKVNGERIIRGIRLKHPID
jgi:phage/plasmid-associated DNA primase